MKSDQLEAGRVSDRLFLEIRLRSPRHLLKFLHHSSPESRIKYLLKSRINTGSLWCTGS